jgi:hypothetical protein
MDKSYTASWGSRICLLLFVVPGSAMFFWAGFAIYESRNVLVGLIFEVVAVLLSIWLIFMLTTRVDMNDRSIVRSWLFGRKVVPIEDITKLQWGGARGQTILTVMYGKRRFIGLSSIVVSRENLLGMQKDILALHGLEGESLWPPMAPYVDIQKMTELKHRNLGFR